MGARGFQKTSIRTEDHRGGDPTIIKVEKDAKTDIREYQFSSLREGGVADYKETKQKYGSFAATDVDRSVKIEKDRRFSLSPLVRGSLAVETEEKRYIEERVRARIKAIQDEATEKAWKQGLEQGKKAGHDEAFRSFQKEGVERLNRIDRFLDYCENAKREIFEANEKMILELVYQICRMVILREVQEDEDYIVRLGKSLVESVGVRENITVKIREEDMRSAEMLKEDLRTSLGQLKNVNIVASADVKDGGVIVETQWNFIDASIARQLSNIYQALLEKELPDRSTQSLEDAMKSEAKTTDHTKATLPDPPAEAKEQSQSDDEQDTE